MIYYGDVRINNLGNLLSFGNIKIDGIIGDVFTVICVIGLLNSINYIDGIDGLSSFITLIPFGALLFLYKWFESSISVSLVIYISASILAFSLVNLGFTGKYIQKVFLGDAGTTMVGFILSWYLIKFSQINEPILKPIHCAWLVCLPIMDILRVSMSRLLNSDSPFTAGSDHVHHI